MNKYIKIFIILLLILYIYMNFEYKYRKYKKKFLKNKIGGGDNNINITPQTMFNLLNNHKYSIAIVNTLSENLIICDKFNESKFISNSYTKNFHEIDDKDKFDAIILYCANYSCSASASYHEKYLKGKNNVYHYPGGMNEWISLSLLFEDKFGVYNLNTERYLNKDELQDLFQKNLHLSETHKYKQQKYKNEKIILDNAISDEDKKLIFEFNNEIDECVYLNEKLMNNKVCVVTGGTSGLGLAVVDLLLKNGAKHVTLTYFNNDERAMKVNEMLGKVYDKSRYFVLKADARTVEGNKTTFDFNERLKYLGDKNICPVDCVDINAGIFGPANIHKKHVFNISEKDYDKVIDINLRAYFLAIKYFTKQAIKNNVKNASIVCIKSIYGSTGSLFSNIAYQTSKHGVMGLVRQSAVELARKNEKLKLSYPIRVNAVSPTFTTTALTKPFLDKSIIKNTIAQSNTTGELAKKQDVAHAVLFLLSDNSHSITGVDLPVDCGVLAESVPTYNEVNMLNNQDIDELSCCGDTL